VPKPKRLLSVIAAAEAQGWTYDETAAGHPRLSPPSGLVDPYRRNRPAAPITFSKTPSDRRGDDNATAYLRRLGVTVPHKHHVNSKEKKQND